MRLKNIIFSVLILFTFTSCDNLFVDHPDQPDVPDESAFSPDYTGMEEEPQASSSESISEIGTMDEETFLASEIEDNPYAVAYTVIHDLYDEVLIGMTGGLIDALIAPAREMDASSDQYEHEWEYTTEIEFPDFEDGNDDASFETVEQDVRLFVETFEEGDPVWEIYLQGEDFDEDFMIIGGTAHETGSDGEFTIENFEDPLAAQSLGIHDWQLEDGELKLLETTLNMELETENDLLENQNDQGISSIYERDGQMVTVSIDAETDDIPDLEIQWNRDSGEGQISVDLGALTPTFCWDEGKEATEC